MTITLLGVTNFLGVINVKTSFTRDCTILSCLGAGYLDSLVSVSLLAYAPSMLTSFEGFPGFLQSDLFVIEDADVKSAYTGSAKDIFDKNVCTKGTYINRSCEKFTCIGNISVGDTYSLDTCIGDIFVRKADISAGAVEYSEIDLQSF